MDICPWLRNGVYPKRIVVLVWLVAGIGIPLVLGGQIPLVLAASIPSTAGLCIYGLASVSGIRTLVGIRQKLSAVFSLVGSIVVLLGMPGMIWTLTALCVAIGFSLIRERSDSRRSFVDGTLKGETHGG